MCVVPAALQAYPHQGSTPLVMTVAGWNAAITALPALPGVSLLVTYPPGGGPGRCVLVTRSAAAAGGLRHRWGFAGQSHGHSWSQQNVAFPQWCCMFAQLTQLSGGVLPNAPQHPNCLAATPMDTWTYEIKWWAQPLGTPGNVIAQDAAALGQANVLAVNQVPGHQDGNIAALNMAALLAMTPPCGC